MEVRPRRGESFESLLRRFRAMVAKEGVLTEFKRHQAFMSKGEKARAKLRRAIRRQRRELRRAA